MLGCIFGWVRNILAVVGLITVIIVIILAVAFWQLTKSPALEGEMRPIELTSTQVSKYADDFEDQVDELEADLLLATVGEEVEVTFTEEMATAKLIEEIEAQDLPFDVDSFWLNFEEDEEGNDVIRLLGKVDTGFATLTAGIEMEMEIVNGEPELTMSELAIGSGFLIPDQAKDIIADAIPTEEALTDMIKGLPIDLTDIDIEDGELTFIGDKE